MSAERRICPECHYPLAEDATREERDADPPRTCSPLRCSAWTLTGRSTPPDPITGSGRMIQLVDDHPLLAKRLAWEAAHPRPEQLRRAERAIVRGLRDAGFGTQHQVTRETGFDIAVDDLLIRVSWEDDDVPDSAA